MREEIIGNCRLILGDCMESLRKMPDNSVDSIVTDPPYGLAFMGKKWDYDVPSVEIWAECLRVLKPGGHLLAFAGTRTQHRMAVRIEDAGFEIRDMIAWVYGSGFPKSHDVSKGIDKAALSGPLFETIRDHIRQWKDARGHSNKSLNLALGLEAKGCGMARHWTSREGGQHLIPSKDQWRNLKGVLGWPDCELDDIYDAVKDGAARPSVGTSRGTRLAVAPGQENDRSAVDLDITAPATDAARQWQGWGTALKPALEPITVARKPFKGTVAANVLEWGTGAINIDGCRINPGELVPGGGNGKANNGGRFGAHETFGVRAVVEPHTSGRWPANLIHDGSDEVMGLFPHTVSGTGNKNVRNRDDRNAYGKGLGAGNGDGIGGDSGSAARFFYAAKASKKDRGEGNVHPTVKPTDLMAYLCRLVTPPGGVVLDPFMGSGSTGNAAMREGFRFIGCELSPEYMTIARARIEDACRQPRLIMDEQPIQEQGAMFEGKE